MRRAALQLHIFCDGELVVWRELCWSGVWVKRRMNLKHVLSENENENEAEARASAFPSAPWPTLLFFAGAEALAIFFIGVLPVPPASPREEAEGRAASGLGPGDDNKTRRVGRFRRRFPTPPTFRPLPLRGPSPTSAAGLQRQQQRQREQMRGSAHDEERPRWAVHCRRCWVIHTRRPARRLI